MVCRNICEKIYSKIVVGESHYFVGKKYCRRCECYFITKKIFCQCCGMQLRSTPAERECKEPKFQTELLSTLFDCKDAKEVVWYDNRRTKEPEETQTGIPLIEKW